MEQALKIWREENMPELRLKSPWFGYALGLWDGEDDALAEAVTRGEYFQSKRQKGMT
jgi:4-hydroxy-3-polyprenylbenzoate decarboxylase